MQSFDALISSLGGPSVVARYLDLKPGTVRQMKLRDSVRATYWPALIEMAADRGVKGVTYPALVRMARHHSSRRRAA